MVIDTFASFYSSSSSVVHEITETHGPRESSLVELRQVSTYIAPCRESFDSFAIIGCCSDPQTYLHNEN